MRHAALVTGIFLSILAAATVGEDARVEAARADWGPAASMAAERAHFTATLLPNGKVLATAGFQGVYSIVNAEIYDAKKDQWSPTGNMLIGERIGHSATLLPDGTVLVVGGGIRHGVSLDSVELYDWRTNQWFTLASMTERRSGHTAVLLDNGTVLVAGGAHCVFTVGCTWHASVELYEPETGNWTTLQPMAHPRSEHTATLLPSGKVLITGGVACSDLDLQGPCNYFADTEIYDPTAGTWASGPNMSQARATFTATSLLDGRVLIAGGALSGAFDPVIDSAEIYDSSSNSWSSAGHMGDARADFAATLLPNGLVLVTGGAGNEGDVPERWYTRTAEVYNPRTNAWSFIDDMQSVRRGHAATVLNNGKVLVVGGFNATSELLAPRISRPTATK